jgi:diphosphomevalonate decarboxylase
MTENDFLPKPYTTAVESGTVSWQSPSNIALIKYWGKYGEQLPQNPSISFTLDACHTKTTLTFSKKNTPGSNYDFEVFFEGKKAESFAPKIEKFFNRVEAYLPFLKHYHFEIHTENTFPHSSGIASSASGMSALALCLTDVEQMLTTEKLSSEMFLRKASFLARLGSGSACRSLEGPLIVWGTHPKISTTSNLFGTAFPFEVHSVFQDYQDTILLVDKGEKQVSSTVGHNLMHNHPFAKQRFQQANDNMEKLIPILKNGDLDGFIAIVESEALSLHAMMMTSLPYFVLMKPNTLEVINRIWQYRKDTGSKVCFTLDAGANVHVLFPEREKASVGSFIEDHLKPFCQHGNYIADRAGEGAKRIEL